MSHVKTLDDVLKAYEICLGRSEDSCSECPYTKNDADGKWACSLCGDCTRDAFLYLKEYKTKRDRILDFERRLGDYEKELENMKLMMLHSAVNELESPITWSELKRMVGKPVWIVESSIEVDDECDVKREGHWDIVKKFYKDQVLFYTRGMSYHRSWMGIGWNAFRKEF